MHKTSPYYLWSRDHLPLLRWRHDRGEFLNGADLARVFEAEPTSASDPLMRELVLRSLNGDLPAKRGRRSVPPGRFSRVLIARYLVEDRANEIRALRRNGTLKWRRGDPTPAEQAAQEVAQYMKFGCGRTLANEISAQKKARNVVRARSLPV